MPLTIVIVYVCAGCGTNITTAFEIDDDIPDTVKCPYCKEDAAQA